MSSKKKPAKASKTKATASNAERTDSDFSLPSSPVTLLQPGLVPKLRFPEFRDCSEWISHSKADLYRFIRNNTLSRDKLNYDQGSVKNIHYGDIHTRFASMFDITREYVPFINPSEALPAAGSDVYCQEGDLVFADASEDTHDVGKCIEIVRLNAQLLVAGQHTILSRRVDDKVSDGFGGHLFQSPYLRSQIQTQAQGTKVYQISASRLGKVKVPIPTLAEQQKIASCLSSLDELIAAQARKLAALRTHKKALMQRLFPRDGETTPRLRFPEFDGAAEWQLRTIGEMFSLINGCAFKPEDWQTSGTPIIRIQNLNDPSAEFNYSQEPFPERNRVEPGDLLFAWSGTLGSSFGARIWKGPSGVLNQHIFKVLMDEQKITLQFALLVLTRVEEEIARRTHGFKASFVHVKKSDLVNVEILLPSLPEQHFIATCLTSLDDLITAQTQKLAALRTHKKALMQQLFPSPEEFEL